MVAYRVHPETGGDAPWRCSGIRAVAQVFGQRDRRKWMATRAGDIVLNWLSGRSLCLYSIGCMCRGPLALHAHSSTLEMAGRYGPPAL